MPVDGAGARAKPVPLRSVLRGAPAATACEAGGRVGDAEQVLDTIGGELAYVAVISVIASVSDCRDAQMKAVRN